jgi:hypothetical protein
MIDIIRKRIGELCLQESEYIFLSASEVRSVLTTIGETGLPEDSAFEGKRFSISGMSLDTAAAKLGSLDFPDETVTIVWFGFFEGVRIRWNLFLKHFGDLWHPSSDDVMVIWPSGHPIVFVSHDEMACIIEN